MLVELFGLRKDLQVILLSFYQWDVGVKGSWVVILLVWELCSWSFGRELFGVLFNVFFQSLEATHKC